MVDRMSDEEEGVAVLHLTRGREGREAKALLRENHVVFASVSSYNDRPILDVGLDRYRGLEAIRLYAQEVLAARDQAVASEEFTE